MILLNKSDNLIVQLLRYTVVGGIAFLFDFGTLYLLTEYLKVYYLLSAAIAFMLGLTINYLLSIIWVFEKRTVKSKNLEFMIFGLIGLVGLGLNEFFMWFLTDILTFHYLFSKIISTFCVYFWNFFIRKFALFN
jgi:putative flippase GtrA